MATHAGKYKITAQDATTVTLQPDVAVTLKGDYADKITSIVLTFGTARDSNAFDIVNRKFNITIGKN